MIHRWRMTNDHNGTPTVREADGRIVCELPRVNTSAEIYQRTANGDIIVHAPELMDAATAYINHPSPETLTQLKRILRKCDGAER